MFDNSKSRIKKVYIPRKTVERGLKGEICTLVFPLSRQPVYPKVRTRSARASVEVISKDKNGLNDKVIYHYAGSQLKGAPSNLVCSRGTILLAKEPFVMFEAERNECLMNGSCGKTCVQGKIPHCVAYIYDYYTTDGELKEEVPLEIKNLISDGYKNNGYAPSNEQCRLYFIPISIEIMTLTRFTKNFDKQTGFDELGDYLREWNERYAGDSSVKSKRKTKSNPWIQVIEAIPAINHSKEFSYEGYIKQFDKEVKNG